MKLTYLFLGSVLFSCSTKIDRKTNWIDTLRSWPRFGSGIEEIRQKDLSQKSILKIQLTKNEAKRVDIQSPFHAKPNMDYWYSCSIKLPTSFPIENKPLTLMQWMAKPKTNLGENVKPPAMALHFVNGVMFATIRTSNQISLKQPDLITKNTLFEISDFDLGVWKDFIFLVKWTSENNSEVRAWVNGKLMGSYAGPAGYADAIGPIFSFGIHRENTKQTHLAYFSDCREGHSYDEVEPNNYH